MLARSDERPFEVERYGRAWLLAGGDSVELISITPSTASEVRSRIASPISGVILTGGPDVEPSRYGALPDEGIELHCDSKRDELDLALIAEADRYQWPLLAICYGCQILAVARGGRLIQDLPAVGIEGHYVREPKDYFAHDVIVSKTSHLLPHRGGRYPVNSRHHQGIATTGDGLVVTATSPDGVIEAVESADSNRFVLGVQFHPENIANDDHSAIFRAFRAACLEHSKEGSCP